MNIVSMQFNERGMFRLVVNGKKSTWTMYKHALVFEGFIALTKYYGEREQIHMIDMKTTFAIQAIEAICNTCEQPTGFNGEFMPKTVCEHMKERYPTLIEGYSE